MALLSTRTSPQRTSLHFTLSKRTSQ